MPPELVVRPLTAADAEPFRALRLEAVEAEPCAFAESPAEINAVSALATADRLNAPHAESIVFGAFARTQLVGTAGCFRSREIKTRHQGRLS